MLSDKIKTRISVFLRGLNPLYVAIALSVILLGGILLVAGISVQNGDTSTYISAWDECYSNGEIDVFRTPVYPIVIGLGKMLFGAEYWDVFVTLVQTIVFYACGIVFSKMVLTVISNRRVAWATVFLYFLFFPILNMINVVGTEALAFSLTSLWVYCVWRFMQRATWSYGIYITLLTITAIMLRPSLLIFCIAIVGLAVAGVFIKAYRRNVLLMLLTLIPVGVVYKVYVNEIERQVGMETISTVSSLNNYFMARQYNDIFPELLSDNPEALEIMYRFQKEGDRLSHDYIIKQWCEINELTATGAMNIKQMFDYAAAVKKNHADVWFKNIGIRIIDSVRSHGPVKNACNYLVVTLYTVVFVVGWIKFRKFSLVNFLTLMIGGGSILSIFLCCQNDFGRLMLPTSVMLILMVGQLLNCLNRHRPILRLLQFYPKEQLSDFASEK